MFLWLRWGKLLKLAASVIFPASIWFCLKFVKGSRCARPATLLKKSLWHRCFPVNFAKFLRTPFLQNTSGRLLLIFIKINEEIKGLNFFENSFLYIACPNNTTFFLKDTRSVKTLLMRSIYFIFFWTKTKFDKV